MQDTKDSADRSPCFRERADEWISTIRNLPRVAGLLWGAYPFATLVTPLLTIGGGALPALYLYCIKKVFDGVGLWMEGDAPAGRSMVITYLCVGFGVTLVRRALERWATFLEEVFRQRIQNHVQMLIARRALSLDMAFFETPSFYDKLKRARDEAMWRPWAIMSACMQGLRQGASFIGYAVVITTLSPWAIPYLLAITIPGLWVQAKFGRLSYVIALDRTPKARRMFYFEQLLTSPQEAKEIRLFQLGTHLVNTWQETFRSFLAQDTRVAAKRNLATFTTEALETLGSLGFYAFCIYRTVTDPLVTVGSLVMCTRALDGTVQSVGEIFRTIGSFYESNLYLNDLFGFIALEPGIKAPESPKPLPEKLSIRFENVTFRYPEEQDAILHDINFEIRAGERVALVGENGAGKTTLVKLLARLYDPEEGRIFVDGTPLREIDPEDWHRRIGIIFQDYAHYAFTARENVGFGRLEHVDDLERVQQAAELSGADKVVAKLNGGWNTLLGKHFDEGHELSIGEWQKVALARAFLRDAPILVLDEPTASLDAKQEYETFAHFNELTDGKTTILISHRFSTVRMVDRILVFHNGRLVDSGSHDELMAQQGRYAELYERQAEAYR